jgi:hypothetical protein
MCLSVGSHNQIMFTSADSVQATFAVLRGIYLYFLELAVYLSPFMYLTLQCPNRQVNVLTDKFENIILGYDNTYKG